MKNSNKKNMADHKDTPRGYNRVLAFGGNTKDSLYANLKSGDKETISGYYFTAHTSQGFIHGSSESDHVIMIRMKKRQVTEVVLLSYETSSVSGGEDTLKEVIPFEGKIMVFWTYEYDPFSIEVIFVDTTEQEIKTASTQFNCFDVEEITTMMQQLYAPLVGSSEPLIALPEIAKIKLSESQAENSHE